MYMEIKLDFMVRILNSIHRVREYFEKTTFNKSFFVSFYRRGFHEENSLQSFISITRIFEIVMKSPAVWVAPSLTQSGGR